MIPLTIVCVVLLVLPFIIGYFHLQSRTHAQPLTVYYRYFMLFNMLLSGFFVAARMYFDGQNAAAISGWAFTPMFSLYAVAIFSMAFMGLVTLYSNSKIMLAPAICWTVFLILSSMLHISQVVTHTISAADVAVIFVHIVYNAVVSFIMLRFLFLFRGKFQALAQT